MKRTSGLSVCVALGVLVACGSSEDNGGASGRNVALEDVPALYAPAACEAARACWGDMFEVMLGGESCEDNTETALSDEFGRIQQAIAAGTVKYDGTRVEACLDAIVARGCSDAAEPAACTEAIDGTVPIGGDCALNAECQGGDTYCKSAGSCPGQCALRESAGVPCRANDDCQPGLRCSKETQRCFEPVGEGAPCGGGIEPECQAGLFCLGENKDQGQAGNCRTMQEAFSGAAGEPCIFDAPLCQADLRCVIEGRDNTTGTITTSCNAPVASGAPCKLAYPDVCPFDEYCAVPPLALSGTCTPKPSAGQPCAARGNDPADICAPGTRCDGGQCRLRQKLGGTCKTSQVCYSEYCVNGGCASSGACE